MSGLTGPLAELMEKMKPKAPDESKEPAPEKKDEDTDKAVWEPATAAEDYDIRLQDGSIRPMSESALRSQVIELKKAGMIDVAHALEMLDVPDWEEIAEAVQKEMELAALAKVQRR